MIKTLLKIRINSEHENSEEYIKTLINDFPKFTDNKKLESLILRNADDEKYKDLTNLKFSILNNNCELAKKYKKKN